MKALSIRQPWAWVIVNGLKDIENRKWNTRFRGPFLVHAGKTFDHDAYHRIKNEFNVALPEVEDFPLGGLVGSAEVTGCVQEHRSRWFFGPSGFTLRDCLPMPLIPLRGKLNFFNVPPEALGNLAGTVAAYDPGTKEARVRLFKEVLVGARVEIRGVNRWSQGVRRMFKDGIPVTVGYPGEWVQIEFLRPAKRGDPVYLLSLDIGVPPGPTPGPTDEPGPPDEPPPPDGPEPPDDKPDGPGGSGAPGGPQQPYISGDTGLPSPLDFPVDRTEPRDKGHGFGG